MTSTEAMRMPQALHPRPAQRQRCFTAVLALRRVSLIPFARRRPRSAASFSRSLAPSDVTKVALRALRSFSRDRLLRRSAIFFALAWALAQEALIGGGGGGG